MNINLPPSVTMIDIKNPCMQILAGRLFLADLHVGIEVFRFRHSNSLHLYGLSVLIASIFWGSMPLNESSAASGVLNWGHAGLLVTLE